MTFLSHLYAPATSTAPNLKKFPYAHDFILDGKPQTFARNSEGRLIPAVGAEVTTRYGKGFIERRHTGGDVIIRIVEFNEALEVPRHLNGGYDTAQEYVARLSTQYNNRMMDQALWFEKTLSDMVTGDRLMNQTIDDDCYLVTLKGALDYLGATTFMYGVSVKPTKKAVATVAQLAYRAKMEALEDTDEEAPEGIADQLAECFGE